MFLGLNAIHVPELWAAFPYYHLPSRPQVIASCRAHAAVCHWSTQLLPSHVPSLDMAMPSFLCILPHLPGAVVTLPAPLLELKDICNSTIILFFLLFFSPFCLNLSPVKHNTLITAVTGNSVTITVCHPFPLGFSK